MRLPTVLLALSGLAAAAQHVGIGPYTPGPQLHWTLGLQRGQPTLSLRAEGSKDGRASRVDSDADLGLQREGSPWGAFLEYHGRASVLQLSYDTLKQSGQRALPRDILLEGTAYPAGTVLSSSVRAKGLGMVYTYKMVNRPDAWVGLDLGLQSLNIDLAALAPGPTPSSQQAHPHLLLPQVGISGWSSGAGGLLESRMYYRYFSRRGAVTTRLGVEARAYLYPRFGVRAFWESSTLRVPAGSLEGDLDLRLEAKAMGAGLVIRF